MEDCPITGDTAYVPGYALTVDSDAKRVRVEWVDAHGTAGSLDVDYAAIVRCSDGEVVASYGEKP